MENRAFISKRTPTTFGQSEFQIAYNRPFYSRPSTPNLRSGSYHKWFWGISCLFGTTLVYLLGFLSTQSTMHQTEPPSVRTAAPAVSKPFLQPGVRTSTPAVSDALLQPIGRTAAPLVSDTQLSDKAFVSIHGGDYLMGDGIDGMMDAQQHQVGVVPFLMAKYEVTVELWDSVVRWGREHGYPDLPAASGKAQNHPVYGISWGDAVKWCNALSEKDSRTPCYYTDTTMQNIVHKGVADITNQHVNWQANGYRLPTEAEWEFAARGGLAGKRFPNGDEITHEYANYHGSAEFRYDKSQRTGTAVTLKSSLPYTAPVGSFPPNGLGLHDMAGNVAEWCWDFYDRNYETPMQRLNNPHGPNKGSNCIVRGGSWRHSAAAARCASRLSLPGDLHASYVGFRWVRSQ